MSEQQPPRRIEVTHRHGGLGTDALRKQDEHRRMLDARNLADRVAALGPPPPRPPAPAKAPTSASRPSVGAVPRPPAVTPAPGSTSRDAAAQAPSGPIVVDVAAAKARQASRAARTAELDRIEAALDRALSTQRFSDQRRRR